MSLISSTDTRVRRLSRNLVAIVLATGVVPLAVLGYVTYALVVPSLDPTDTATLIAVQALVSLAALGILGGAYVISQLARTVARTADTMVEIEKRGGDVGTLMESFTTMLRTIEQQAADINAFQSRLDDAYKELENTNVRLKETSFKDEVTGLYNRRFFLVRLEEELSRHRRFNHPVAIVLFDLDGFKAVNDELGHAVGDETLRDVGQILMKHSRGINVVARYGGDEFAILLVETSKAGARLYADRIRQVLSSYPYSHGKRVTASFGVASLPDDEALTSEDLFRAADEALYIAKRGGKNQVAGARSQESHEKVT